MYPTKKPTSRPDRRRHGSGVVARDLTPIYGTSQDVHGVDNATNTKTTFRKFEGGIVVSGEHAAENTCEIDALGLAGITRRNGTATQGDLQSVDRIQLGAACWTD